MKEYRFAVRELAHELASADRRGRHLDLLMLTGTLFTGGAALVVTGFFLISAEVPELAPAFWMVVLAWLATVVFTAWFLSLREQRVEYYRPFAEEVLQRTGHGWRGRPASEQSEAETA
jgi:Trk-type K+ transport system membrane component